MRCDGRTPGDDEIDTRGVTYNFVLAKPPAKRSFFFSWRTLPPRERFCPAPSK